MPQLLNKYWKQLAVYHSIKNSGVRKLLLREYVKDFAFLKLLRQIARNTLKKNFLIDKVRLRKLRSKKTSLISLTKKYRSKAKAKKVALQSGSGILPILIPLLASVIGSLIQ